MKHINTYRALAISMLLLVGSVVHAEVAGLQNDAECISDKITEGNQLGKMITDLSAQTPKAQITSTLYYNDYFDAKNNRYVFCMDTNSANTKVKIVSPLTISNTTQYPVIIKNLIIDSSKKDANGNYLIPSGQSMLTIASGTGEIALQNLKADNLRAPILLQGKTTFLDSTISCDAAQATPAITVTSSNNTFRKVNINECATGLDLTGGFNVFYELAIRKTATDESQIGSLGISASGGRNTFYALMIQNYKVGALLSASGNRIFGLDVPEGTANALKTVDGKFVIPSVIAGFTTQNIIPASSPEESEKIEKIPVKDSIGVYFKFAGTLETSKVDGFQRGVVALANKVNILRNFELGGTLGAVVIGHDPITNLAYQPVTVSKNTFTTADTIIYVENGDKAAYRLLGVEWMGKKVDEKDPTKAKIIVGKLLDQNNASQYVELGVWDEQDPTKYELLYTMICNVFLASERIPIYFKLQDGTSETKNIEINEKYFACDKSKDVSSELMIPLKNKVRFHSNTPTVSVMSDETTPKDMGDITVLVGAASSLPIGSGDLAGGQQGSGTGEAQAQTLDGGGLGNLPSGGSVPPADVHDVGENSGNSGSSMFAGSGGLDAGIPTVAGGGTESAGVAGGFLGGAASGRGCSLIGAIEGQNNAASALIWLLALLPIPILLPMRNRKR